MFRFTPITFKIKVNGMDEYQIRQLAVRFKDATPEQRATLAGLVAALVAKYDMEVGEGDDKGGGDGIAKND